MTSQVSVNLHATNVQSTMFGLAKRHILAAQIRSTAAFKSIFEKRTFAIVTARNSLMSVPKSWKENSRVISSVIKSSHPLPPTPDSTSDNGTDILSTDGSDDSDESTCALTVIPPTDSEDENDEPRGRPPQVPPKLMGYVKRYSVGLRGRTPSPARDSSSEEGSQESLPRHRCSKRWRNARRCATPPPLPHRLRRVDRRLPEAPREVIITVQPKPYVAYEPLPLEGRGWTDSDAVHGFSLYGYVPFASSTQLGEMDPDHSWDSSMSSDI